MDEELHQLCKEVYELTGWKYTIGRFHDDGSYDGYVGRRSIAYTPSPQDSEWLPKEIPLYTSDYLLEKLPEEVKKRVLVVTNGDRPHAGYAERDNYGNFTLDEYYWKNVQYSDEVRKALLKLTIALSEAGELNE